MTSVLDTQQEHAQVNKWVMAMCCLLAFPLAAVLLLHPAAMLDDNGEYSHRAMMWIMIGISGGLIYGVGFVPKFWLWKWLFNPVVAWPLMLYGYYTWFLT